MCWSFAIRGSDHLVRGEQDASCFICQELQQDSASFAQTPFGDVSAHRGCIFMFLTVLFTVLQSLFPVLLVQVTTRLQPLEPDGLVASQFANAYEASRIWVNGALNQMTKIVKQVEIQGIPHGRSRCSPPVSSVRIYRDQWTILDLEFKYADGSSFKTGSGTSTYDEWSLSTDSNECIATIEQYMDKSQTDGDGSGHKRRIVLVTSTGRKLTTTSVMSIPDWTDPAIRADLTAPSGRCIVKAGGLLSECVILCVCVCVCNLACMYAGVNACVYVRPYVCIV